MPVVHILSPATSQFPKENYCMKQSPPRKQLAASTGPNISSHLQIPNFNERLHNNPPIERIQESNTSIRQHTLVFCKDLF